MSNELYQLQAGGLVCETATKSSYYNPPLIYGRKVSSVPFIIE